MNMVVVEVVVVEVMLILDASKEEEAGETWGPDNLWITL